MKNFKSPKFAVQILIMLFALTLANCSVKVGSHPHHSSGQTKQIPPGQAKKMTGDKSAKNHAPGHNK